MKSLVILALGLALTCCACGDISPEKAILGRWEVRADDRTMTLVFAPDYKVVASTNDKTSSGTWSVKNGSYIVTINNHAATAIIDVNGDLVVTEAGNAKYIMTKVDKVKKK